MCWLVNRHLPPHIVLQTGHKAVPQWRVGETMTVREFLTTGIGKLSAVGQRACPRSVSL